MHRPKDQGGFAFVELLVIMVIIAVLAAIAIPIYLNQRRNGFESAVKSDLKNAATALEAWAADRTSGFAASGADTPDAVLADREQFSRSPGVTVSAISSSRDDYCLKATHTSLGSAPGDIWYFTKVKQGSEVPGVPTRTVCS